MHDTTPKHDIKAGYVAVSRCGRSPSLYGIRMKIHCIVRPIWCDSHVALFYGEMET